MTPIEQIKAEIEKQADNYQDTYTDCMRDNLLSFIESLEKERKEKFQEYLKAAPAKRRKFDLSFLGDEIKLTREELEEICDLPRKDAPKIKGWVARDENGDLYAFVKKPERCFGEFELKNKTLLDDFTGNVSIRLPKEEFPDLKWKNEPIEVELTIRKA